MGTLESESVQGRVVAVLITVVLTPLPKLQSCLRRRCCTQFFYGPSILLHRFSWFYCHSLAATPLRNGCIIAIPRCFSWAVETLNCPWVADWYITGDETWLDGCNWIFHLTIWNCRWWEHSHQFIDLSLRWLVYTFGWWPQTISFQMTVCKTDSSDMRIVQVDAQSYSSTNIESAISALSTVYSQILANIGWILAKSWTPSLTAKSWWYYCKLLHSDLVAFLIGDRVQNRCAYWSMT